MSVEWNVFEFKLLSLMDRFGIDENIAKLAIILGNKDFEVAEKYIPMLRLINQETRIISTNQLVETVKYICELSKFEE